MEINRREFLRFMGSSTLGMSMASTLSLLNLSNCSSRPGSNGYPSIPSLQKLSIFPELVPTNVDDLMLMAPLEYDLLVSWGDPIQNSFFGFNNDYLAFVSNTKSFDEGLLWVNHEYPADDFYFRKDGIIQKNKARIMAEMRSVGGSIVPVKKDKMGKWKLNVNSKSFKRIDGFTKIPFSTPLNGKTHAIGMVGNCAGGVTPWKSILTCEENYDDYYGEVEYGSPSDQRTESIYGWEKVYPDRHPHDYGWVVEVNPLTGAAKKLISLGRFAHECATCVTLKNGKVAVYSADDKIDEHLYKFISSSTNSLDQGTLYVAKINGTKGEWIALDIEQQPLLKNKFKNQQEVLINTRIAAKLLGATPLERPEDVEIHPITGDIYVALTHAVPEKGHYGKILRIKETNSDYASLTFLAEDFLLGGTFPGFGNPDNLCFDPEGNLYITTDYTGKKKDDFKNNVLFFVPMSSKYPVGSIGKPYIIASAPVGAEFTGPCLSSDKKTLFLSVQHPGEKSAKEGKWRSQWPRVQAKPSARIDWESDWKINEIPRPSVITIDISKIPQILLAQN